MKSSNSVNGFLSALSPFIGIFMFMAVFMSLNNWLEKKVTTDKLEQKRIASLFIPHSGKLNIETFVYETNGDEILTRKNILKNVSFAQLKLYPTIGCTRPVLFYLVDGSSQVRQMPVDEAKIIN